MMINMRIEVMSKISNLIFILINEVLFLELFVCVVIYYKIKWYIGFCFIYLIIG